MALAQEPFPVPGEDPDRAGGVGAGAARQTRAGPRVQGQAGRRSTLVSCRIARVHDHNNVLLDSESVIV